MQAPPFVLQHKKQPMVQTFVPTTRAAMLGAIEMLAKHASLWFSKPLYCCKGLIRLSNSLGAKAANGEARRTSCKPQEIGQLSPKP
jgi:hypothetical protein